MSFIIITYIIIAFLAGVLSTIGFYVLADRIASKKIEQQDAYDAYLETIKLENSEENKGTSLIFNRYENDQNF
ncbi:hypothetical protein EZY14_009025 [Kordia sp. TARA_039_SRF]|nr:hypothetical protein EZY14_009025 [Kordia sp. TARA_039_SRF]